MQRPGELYRKLGFWSATSIIIGSIIGSGIFINPSFMAIELRSPVWMILVWVIAGLFTFFGALIYAELGSMFPETGGLYVFFRKIFGNFVAYLYGWSAFSVINTASVAAISFVCAEYANYFLFLPRLDPETERSFLLNSPFIGKLYPLENIGVKGLAILIVLGLTWLNTRTVKGSAALQVISTFIKVGVIIALVVGIFFSGNGNTRNFIDAVDPRSGPGLITGIVIALTFAFYTYDGWTNVTFVAGEIREPRRNIPRSLLLGVSACILIYLLVNLAYLYVLPVETIARSPLVASDAISKAWGTEGGILIAVLIAICIFGSVNGNVLACARVTYAMGKDRNFFSWTGKEHTRFNTPANALWLHATWICVFILSGSFNLLANMFVFVTWIAYLLGAIGVIMLRKKMPEIDRPYKTWGYPWVPLLFILFTSYYLVTTIVNDITNYINDEQPVINSLLGLVIVAMGIPFYFYLRYKKRDS